ncbi:DUF4352 domain-containing protein [Alkalicoccobacillus gibsonii]|uniref:DUF4352 domain-containing protein n=1 Tax=Alkalicoccobacillus gibsonii TaxID=79881 RepID=A0ABU9VET8_9BACI
MKKISSFFAITLLTAFVLGACGGNAGNDSDQEPVQEEQVDEEETSLVDRDELEEEKEEDQNSPNLGAGDTEDQLDLAIGDTGTIETTIEKFEMTIESIQMESEIDGETPDLGVFILANVEFKNIHDEALDLQQAVDTFEVTTTEDGGGYGPVSEYYNVVIDAFEGELEPGDTVKGQILFEDQQGDTHYIKVNPGLVASSAVKNQVTWSFTEEDSD